MPSSFVCVLTGDPGIGNPPFVTNFQCSVTKLRVFYFSSEESLPQVKGRAQRLDCASGNLLFSDQADLEAHHSHGAARKA